MQITPCLWFENSAEEAAKHYLSTFKNSKIVKIDYYGESSSKVSGQKKGSVLTVELKINGQTFVLLNGGPIFKLSPAVSFMIFCKNEKEVNHYYKKLSAVPEAEQCGWVQDKFGVSWQIVPEKLDKLLNDKNPKRSERVMSCFLEMKRIDMKKLEEVYRSK